MRVSDPEWMVSRLSKTLTLDPVFVLAWSAGRDGLDPTDTHKLRLAFVAILTGDLLFLLDEIHPAFDYPAILAFLVGHVLIILRNGQGLRDYLAVLTRCTETLVAVGILLGTAILFVFTLLEHLWGSPMLYMILVYAIVLDVSLWTRVDQPAHRPLSAP